MSFQLRVLRLVRRIPRGQVATYGQIAALAGHAGAARACGHILRQSSDELDLPWQRVINSQGRISSGGDVHRPLLQRKLLEAEGVVFSRSGRCALEQYRWTPTDDELVFLDDEDADEDDGPELR
ncbi:MAG: MGMT family protein [Myxococcota bacterium]